MARAPLLLLALLSGLLAGPTCASRPYVPLLDAFDCPLMPDDSYWHADVSALPVHPRSEAWVHSIGLDAPVHPDFGSSPRFGGLSLGGPVGIPYVTVGQRQPRVPVSFDFAAESDPGPYPIPADAPIEGGTDSLGDRHVLVVDGRACILYELFDAIPEADGSWSAGSGAIFRLGTNELRPEGWTSADAAGLPILPGLVRFEEAALGLVGHALRFTAPRTQSAALWPARHFASADADPDLPPWERGSGSGPRSTPRASLPWCVRSSRP